MRRIVLIIFLIWLPMAFAAQRVYLSAMRIQPSVDSTRITFTLSQKTSGKIKYIPNPDRLIVEFTNTYKNFTMDKARLGGANVISVNSYTTNGKVRFVFAVTGKVTWQVNFLPQKNNVLMQLDIISDKPVTKKTSLPTPKANKPIQIKSAFNDEAILKEIAELAASKKKEVNDDVNLTGRARLDQQTAISVAKKNQTFTVIIDAGHGGKDSGAVGAKGVKEKDVVLAIAKQLAKKINQTPNMRAILTRSSDHFVSLRERLKVARKSNADLFIAIHADAYFDNSATGASVYALSHRGATSEAARWLAKRDNYSELDGVELDLLKDRSIMLRSVLIDLAQTATIQDSLRLGNKLLDALDNVSTLHYKHVEQAPFVVLKSPDIPSILIETGFITNPKEEKRLNDPSYQEQLAQAIWQGVSGYRKSGVAQ